ncbi:MAG: dehydrogenase [Elusimicrobia bacterium]|nr:dehydrogenase [Elusimicrobiota bacterium]
MSLLTIAGLRIPLEADGEAARLKAAAGELGLGVNEIKLVKILAQAPDISDPERFFQVLTVVVGVPAGYNNERKFPAYVDAAKPARPRPNLKERPIIIGFGPAGMFAALELMERGLKPLIFERGKKIEERSADVRRFITDRALDTESNIQFGEGGAGAYSDGKLFSRVNNSHYGNKVLETFVRFGARPEIAWMAKPHVGTDVLCAVVRNIRDFILERGGEIHYGAKLTDLRLAGGKACGVVINGRQEYLSSRIYLAVGHSARDTFELLRQKGAALERRAIAVGVRIEHPAPTIDLLRYGAKYKDHPALGAAAYSLNHTNRRSGRGTYTFCMCPGGEIVNASSAQGLLAVNGMSRAARDGEFSNGALVVTCHAADYGGAGPLAGFGFQEEIERRAFKAGGGNWAVPAQNLTDFIGGKLSGKVNRNSCKTGTAAADLRQVLPNFVTAELLAAFAEFKKGYPLFVSEQAVLLAPETRTSCPVKVPRGENYGSVNIENLYPIGEGAGYAGGITSSAIDAIKGVERSLGETL